MKFSIQKFTLLIFSVTCILASCSKAPNKILPKKTGKWNASITSHVTATGYDVTTKKTITLTFDKAGTGIYSDSSGAVVNFTWSYAKDSKKITYQKTGSSVIVFDVTGMEKTTEQWHNVSLEIIAFDTQTTDLTIDLTKAD